jgi:ribosome-associated protein
MDHAPIEAQLAEIAGESASASRALHRIEAWRDRLIAEGDTALGELMAAYPQTERPRVRRLIDSARLERERAQPPRSSRLLFKYLRELLEPDHPSRGGVG